MISSHCAEKLGSMDILDLVPALMGVLVGGAAAWFHAKARFRSELGVLEERVAAKDEQLRMSWGDVDALKAELLKAQQLFRQEAHARLAAEKGVARAQVLEKTLAARDHQVTQLTQEQVALKSQVAEQSARLALLNETKEVLGESFKAISAETIKAGSEAFRDLAR